MLTAGSRLGPYEIREPVGAGGMGEVYRAFDRRLGRSVALKVLPTRFSEDPDRLRRFEREARAAGQINHPNILAIHDVGTEQGSPFVVSELLQGRTLREHVRAGPLPTRRTLEYGLQIARGLAAAHAQGIIHRDLKPENLFVTEDHRVKILDFGLARLTHPEPREATGEDQQVTSGSLTESGAILGTVGYMAPEQARGESVDHRADIFSLGAVLYEMASGQHAFPGNSPVAILYALITREPDPLESKNPQLPEALVRIIGHCLEKDPGQRCQSAVDLGFDLELLLGSAGRRMLANAAGPTSPLRPSRAARFIWVATAVAAAAIALVLLPPTIRRLAAGHPVRLSVDLPRDVTFHGYANSAVSPDGRTLAFAAFDSSETSRLWIRPLDADEAHALAGTEGAYFPFWSPDSRSLGFFSHGKLCIVPATGGPAVSLADAPAGRGGSWSRDGVILFAPNTEGAIYRVASTGGGAERVTTLDASHREIAHRWPCFLPDRRPFLYLALPARGDAFDIYVGDLQSSRRKPVLKASTAATYAAPGFLLFVRNQTLVAQRFHVSQQRLSGEPIPVASTPLVLGALGEPNVSTSSNGVLAFLSADRANNRLAWLDRTGRPLGAAQLPPGAYAALALSPDNLQIALERTSTATSSDILLLELLRGTTTRLTFDPMLDRFPLWSPDGERVVFASNRDGSYQLYAKSANATGPEQMLPTGPSALLKWPTDWSRDGSWIAYDAYDSTAGFDLWAAPVSGDRPPVLYLRTPSNESGGRFSPDGRWLAYTSNESGRTEVYVQSFPVPGRRTQVSNGGGDQPRWRRDGRELFYIAPGEKLMGVRVQIRPTFSVGEPVALIERRAIQGYDVGADGERFLCLVPAAENTTPISLSIILQWSAGLRP